MSWRILAAAALALLLPACWQQNVGRTYYASGKLRSEATVKNNVLDGTATMYYESGAKMSEAHYRAGALQGLSIAFYENGARKAQAEYKDGMLDGTSIAWTPDGRVERQARFVAGRLAEPESNPNHPPAIGAERRPAQ